MTGTSTAHPPQPEDVVEELRQWLAENWSPDRPEAEWRVAVVKSGWSAPTWPVEWFGRGLPRDYRKLVNTEFRRVGATGTGQDVRNLYANTILAHGTEEQKAHLLPPLALGEHKGCLLYSEPGAGSDLAALQTRAERQGSDWLVNGQKVWTSNGRDATHGMLVARSDWDQPKHRGITFFWFPMQQPGVDVRPIRQVTGGAEFNEVFITDAVVADDHRLGEVNGGWRVLQTALGFERQIMGSAALSRPADQAAAKDDPLARKNWRESPWTRRVGGADYVDLARTTGRAADAVIRQQVAHLYTLEQVNKWNGVRARAETSSGASSPVASLGKLAMSRIVHQGVALTSSMLGASAMLDGEEAPVPAEVNRSAFAAFVSSIGGGTDQIQRNIIGERILGLPKEPEVDRDVPFRDVRKAKATRRFS
jgi:alkylation response protein AidB-like acyl-CoA dehydrogenase